MVVSALDSPKSAIARDAEEFIEVEEDSDETFELPDTEKPSRPPIELKSLSSGLRYAFLNSYLECPRIISDKLSEVEARSSLS